MAQKRMQIDTKKVRDLASLYCEPEEAAATLGLSCDVFQTSLKADLVVREAWEEGRALARVRLRRALFRQSETNASVAKFLAENILGYRDHAPLRDGDGADDKALTVVDIVRRVYERKAGKDRDHGSSSSQRRCAPYRH